MPQSFAVVCEADADRRMACALVDRILVENEHIDWIAPEVLDSYRLWKSFGGGRDHATWEDVRDRAKELNIKVHGSPNGEHRQVRLAILLFNRKEHLADALCIVRDTDDKSWKPATIRAARGREPTAFPVVLGIPHPEREAWVVAGFKPRNEHERRKLVTLANEIGFDPSVQPNQMNCEEGSPRETKRVLRSLTDGDFEREQQCFLDTPLADLRTRGSEIGLTDFLREIEERIIPLFTGGTHRNRN